MKTLGAIPAIALSVLGASSAKASILDFKSLAIDFTNATDATAKATWSELTEKNAEPESGHVRAACRSQRQLLDPRSGSPDHSVLSCL